MTRCMSFGCDAQATRITIMEEGGSFWCDEHDPHLVELERQLCGEGMSASLRRQRVLKVLDQVRGTVATEDSTTIHGCEQP
jgi:hypothetical protein